MLGLVNYSSDDDNNSDNEQQQEAPKVQPQQTALAASPQAKLPEAVTKPNNNINTANSNSIASVLPGVPAASKKRAKSKKPKRNMKDLFNKLGIDINAMKQGKLTSTLLKDDDTTKQADENDETQDEDEFNDTEQPLAKRQRLAAALKSQDNNNEEDPDAPEIEDEANDGNELQDARVAAFGKRKLAAHEIADAPDGVAMPSMSENSDFMMKFKSKVSSSSAAAASSSSSSTANNSEQDIATAKPRAAIQPVFEKIEKSSIAASSSSAINNKSSSINVDEVAFAAPTATNAPREDQDAKAAAARKQLSKIKAVVADDDNEFEIDASEYDAGTSISANDETEPTIEDDEENIGGEEVIIQQEPMHIPANGAPALPRNFLLQQNAEEEEEPDYEEDEEEEGDLPSNLPEHILQQLNKPGVNIVNVTGKPSDMLSDEQRRRAMMEKHRRSAYLFQPKGNNATGKNAKKGTIEDDNYDPNKFARMFGQTGRAKHQITFMGQEVAQRELEMADRHDRAIVSKKQAGRKYGWT